MVQEFIINVAKYGKETYVKVSHQKHSNIMQQFLSIMFVNVNHNVSICFTLSKCMREVVFDYQYIWLCMCEYDFLVCQAVSVFFVCFVI